MITPAFSLTATERVLPSMALDFTTASLDSRVTFTRSGNTATVTNSSGYVVGINADLPRFDFDPIALTCKGLLIEEAKTNVCLQSEDFNTTWTKLNLTVTTNSITAPSNALTADTIVPVAGTAAHAMIQTFTVAAATTYTYSVFAKAGGSSYCQVVYDNGSGIGGFINVNLSTGAITRGPEAAGGATNIAGGVTAYPNGWYRISISAQQATIVGRVAVSILNAATSTGGIFPSPTLAVTDTIYLWGAQLEAGAFGTSYIPTVASQVTRTADVAEMTGTNFSNWYNASEGAFVGQGLSFVPASISQFNKLIFVSDNNPALTNYYDLGRSANNSRVFGSTAGVNFVSISNGTWAINTVGKPSIGYIVNNISAVFNAGTPVTDSNQNIPVVNRMDIGSSLTFSNFWNGHIQKIAYYKQRLLNAELQAFSK